MRIRLQLFALARQALGCESVELELPSDAKVGDLRRELVARAPKLEAAASHFAFAVNQEYAADATPLVAGDEVACIPPVSGG